MQTVRGQHLLEGDLEPLGSRWLLNASTVCLNESPSIPNANDEIKNDCLGATRTTRQSQGTISTKPLLRNPCRTTDNPTITQSCQEKTIGRVIRIEPCRTTHTSAIR